MAMGVVQGSSGFPFMALPMYKYLNGSEISSITIEIDDKPNEGIHLIWHLLQEAT